MKRLTFLGGLVLGLGVGAVACGSDGPGNDAPARFIAGGGTGDGAIDGVVNVHVIDEDSDEPLAGARVLIGEVGEEPLEGLTDTAGLFRFEDGGLDGPTTITVVATGHVVSTWYGVNAANVTIPVDKTTSSTTVAKATLTGTIDDWGSMAPPAAGHFRAAFVTYSQSDDLGDDANNIEQPAANPPPNMCVVTVPATPCSWSLIARTGNVAVFATIIDVDTKGTQDDSDDEITTIGLAYKLGLLVEDGVNMSAITLKMVDEADLDDVTLTVPSTPTGLDQVGAAMGVDTGRDGIMMLAFAQDPTSVAVLVPKLTGDLATMSYRALAFAGDSQDPEDGDENKMSASILRNITTAGTIALPDWMPMASGMKREAGVYSFTPVPDTAFHGGKLIDSDDKVVWNVALMDGRTSFELPTVSPNPVPTGALDMSIDAFDGDVDLHDFEIDSFIHTFRRISKGRVTLP